ncbi:hypothetical protein SKAU_G00273020 [Synaphobranchus kaupii]|uniref:Uncharacterized protein n=1 Tax=Synaphobranchus kaupii TaxID=118154 RepID=A0A9Q1F0R1_SYNKA|nr:hypothetical protein SKAU_G00273020 [Synaphobranchus kaupii]
MEGRKFYRFIYFVRCHGTGNTFQRSSQLKLGSECNCSLYSNWTSDCGPEHGIAGRELRPHRNERNTWLDAFHTATGRAITPATHSPVTPKSKVSAAKGRGNRSERPAADRTGRGFVHLRHAAGHHSGPGQQGARKWRGTGVAGANVMLEEVKLVKDEEGTGPSQGEPRRQPTRQGTLGRERPAPPRSPNGVPTTAATQNPALPALAVHRQRGFAGPFADSVLCF